MEGSITWVGIDAHKKSLAVAVLAPGMRQPEEFTVENNEKAIRKLARRLTRTSKGHEVRACYEAGTCGYTLRPVLEENVILVGEHDEEVPLRAGLPFAVLQPLRLDRDARCVGREAEGLLLRLLRARVDDAPERCPNVLGVAAHVLSSSEMPSDDSSSARRWNGIPQRNFFVSRYAMNEGASMPRS